MSASPPPSQAREASPAPAGMPLAQPSLLRVLTLCVAWAGVVTVHYGVCGWFAWRLGDPTELPLWLKPWNELMRYGISSLLTLLLALVWWTVAGLLFVPGVGAVLGVDRVLRLVDDRDAFGRAPSSAVGQSLGAMAPVLGITGLSLLILPFEAPYKSDDSGLQLADQMSYPAFAEYMFLSLFGMLTIYVLFAGFGVGVALMMRFCGDGGAWQILPPVFLGIITAMLFGLVIGPWAVKLPHEWGVFSATAGFIAGMTLLSVPPMLLMLRGK